MMAGGTDAVLGFCLPVDRDTGRGALAPYRTMRDDAHLIVMTSRAAAGIAIDYMHREARLRIWDNPDFTTMPTYLIWRVEPDGVLIRAYHQTVLALRVDAGDPDYLAGIQRGSLDGYFSELLADKSGVRHATDSDEVMVFSLHHTVGHSAAPTDRTRDECLRDCLRTSIGPGQRRFAERPFMVKRDLSAGRRWTEVAQESEAILSAFHATTPPDPAAFERVYAARSDLDALDSRWRRPSGGSATRLRMWLYRKVVVQLVSGPAGRVARRVLGRERARAIWARLNAWFFGEGSAG